MNKIKEACLFIVAQIPIFFFVLLLISESFWLMAKVIVIVDMFCCWGFAVHMIINSDLIEGEKE